MEQGWKEYFVFSHRERWAVIVLLLCVGVMWSLHLLFPPSKKKLEITWVNLESKTGRPGEGETWKRKDVNSIRDGEEIQSRRHVTGFYFDPNTASPQEWMKLGLSEKQVRIITNYVSKGGRFRKPEDLSRIYGLPAEMAEALIPFVRIKNQRPKYQEHRSQVQLTKIEINTASLEELDKLPGIGLKLGERILKFRDALGGFNSVDQVRETFGLQDSVFQKIRPYLICNGSVNSIDINSADKKILAGHPYLRGNVAMSIFNYRQEHGQFNSLEDLRSIPAVTPELFQKVRPYLTIGRKINPEKY